MISAILKWQLSCSVSQITSSGNYYQLDLAAQLFHRCARSPPTTPNYSMHIFKRHYTTLKVLNTISSCSFYSSSSPLSLPPPVSGTLDALPHLLCLTLLRRHVVQHLHHLSDGKGEFQFLKGRVSPGWARATFVPLWSLERAPGEAHEALLRSPVTAATGLEAPK